jgi:hypothetical protein
LNVPVLGPSPCAGVYGTVRSGGVLKQGDEVCIATAPDPVDDPETRAGFTAMTEDMERVMSQLGGP